MVNIGYCKDCKFSKKLFDNDLNEEIEDVLICDNDKKLGDYFNNDCLTDELSYSYNEGGVIHVGAKFGCIHWTKK